MYPVILSIGKLNIYRHGLMIAVGAVLAGFLLYSLARRKGMPTFFLLDMCLYTLLAGLIGARLLYFALYSAQFAHWYDFFFIWEGGLVSYGGFIGGLALLFVYLKGRRQSVWAWLDLMVAPFFLGWAFGRVGCFLAGDILGIGSGSNLAIQGRLPVTLFEAGLSILVVLLAFVMSFRKINLPSGLVFSANLAIYAIGRLAIDFFREDSLFYKIKINQIGDALVVLITLFLLFIIFRRMIEGGERRQHGV